MIKYAEAKEVFIQITRHEDVIQLMIEDDGKGFDTSIHTTESEGLGLHSMRNRASSIGGTIQIDSAPERGTTILVEAPF